MFLRYLHLHMNFFMLGLASAEKMTALLRGSPRKLGDCRLFPSTPKNWQEWSRLDYDATAQCDASDDHACFGNGECACGTCVCDVGWRGPYCSQLDLLPAKRSAPGVPMDGGHPTWGGSAVFEDGKWQLLVGSKIALPGSEDLDPETYWDREPAYDGSRLSDGEGQPFGEDAHPWEFTVDPLKDPFPDGGNKIDGGRDMYEPKAWLSLYESEGEDAAGPYHKKISKWFKAFRADLKRDPQSGALLNLSNANGGFTILLSSSGSIKGPWTDASDAPIDSLWAGGTPGIIPTDITSMPQPVYKFVDNGHCVKGWGSLDNLSGKYVTRDDGQFRECTAEEKDAWNCHLADPALLIHPNGTAVIAYRGTRCESLDGNKDHTERIGLLFAPDWRGPYLKGEDPILADDEVMNGGLEDLFMWQDHRGTHMIVHSQAQDHAYDTSLDQATFHHKKKRGAYLFSKDGRDRWSLSDWELYPSEIRWEDGVTEFLLKQQRPSLIFNPETGRPSHLVTGVDYLFDPCCDWYAYGSAWTLVQPISTCPAGQVLHFLSGSCETCLSNDSHYGGRCEEATSKYGSCVCAVCKGGYSGDKCEIAPEPVYETVCEEFLSSNECEDMNGEAKWLGRETVDEGTCLQDCYAYAVENDFEGCCFQYAHATNRNCRFFESQGRADTSRSEKAASICIRRIVTAAPTTSPTGCPIDDGRYEGRCTDAATKEGSCACVACECGYSGDKCEIAPEPVYEMVCEELQPLNECEDMGSEVRKWLGRQTVDDGTCLKDCQAYAVENNMNGCCFQNSHPTNRNCRFFNAQHRIEIQDKPSNAFRAASACYEKLVKCQLSSDY